MTDSMQYTNDAAEIARIALQLEEYNNCSSPPDVKREDASYSHSPEIAVTSEPHNAHVGYENRIELDAHIQNTQNLIGSPPKFLSPPPPYQRTSNAALSAPLSTLVPANTGLLSPNPPPPLPSMLRYVDNYLLRNVRLHNHPPNPAAVCPICHYQHNQSPIPTTFLPLWPCNHWMHYRCFIWHTTRLGAARDKCPCCNTPLFIWEGMTVLTLAARTCLELESENLSRLQYDKDTRMWVKNSGEQYESDCALIDVLVRRHWNKEMTRLNMHPSTFVQDQAPVIQYKPIDKPLPPLSQHLEDPRDRSPNLVAMFYNILSEVEHMGRPRSAWLGRQTEVGFFLWGMLIWIKTKGFLEESGRWVVGTEGWRKFEEGGKALQGKILAEVGSTGSSNGPLN